MEELPCQLAGSTSARTGGPTRYQRHSADSSTQSYPPVTIVIPWKEGDPLNIPEHDPIDEVLIATGGTCPGDARLEAAKVASNEWIVYTDGDAEYPSDYVPKIKEFIRSNPGMRGFRTERIGGLHNLMNYEASMVLRRDYVFEVVGDRYEPPPPDFGYKFFSRLPVIRGITYSHSLTNVEKRTLVGAGAVAVGLLAWHYSR